MITYTDQYMQRFQNKGCINDTGNIAGLAHWPIGSSIRQESGRPRFNPTSRHTKDF